MDRGGSGNDFGIGDGRGREELAGAFRLDCSKRRESGSNFRGDETLLELAGVERARCGLLGLKFGTGDSDRMWALVSIVRFRARRCPRSSAFTGKGDPSLCCLRLLADTECSAWENV